MRRNAPIVFIFLAVILAGAAAWGAQLWIKGQARRAAAGQLGLRQVVVAKADLSAGHILEVGNLSVQRWPRASLPPGYFSIPGKLTGRVVRTPLVKGEVILDSKLARQGLAGGLSAVLPRGFRAMTLKVDEVIGVGGFVQPGDKVDVLLTFAKGNFREDPITRIVLQNVQVLTVGARVEGQDIKKKNFKRVKKAVVTLILKPADAERLALAMLEGKVVLALRNQGDSLGRPTGGVRLTSLLGNPGAERAAVQQTAPPVGKPKEKAAAPRPTVEVIKGVKRSVETL